MAKNNSATPPEDDMSAWELPPPRMCPCIIIPIKNDVLIDLVPRVRRRSPSSIIDVTELDRSALMAVSDIMRGKFND